MASGIYAIENLKTGRRYVGSACCLKRRAKEHFRHLSRGVHHSAYLQRSYNAHGGDNFVFRHVLYCAPSDLIMYEQIVMQAYQPEYNVAPVAGSMLGYTHTDETRAKMRAARARNGYFSPMKGRTQTEDARKKISKNRKGKGGKSGWTQERRDRISAALKGRHVSDEMKAKISASLTGRKQSAETIEKRAAKARGRKMPEGFSEAARARMLGRKMSEEAIAKMVRSKSIYSEEQIRTVRALSGAGVSARKMEKMTGVNRNSIPSIIAGKTYRWVE
jgi:excinuclease UvrABC nuclease subunit